MVSETKRISITDSVHAKNTIEIKKDAREKKWYQEKKVIDRSIEQLYKDKQMAYLEKPTKCGSIWSVFVLPVIFGLLAGVIGGFFILTRETINIPFLKEINFRQYFPTREINVITEKSITVTQDLRVAELVKKIKPLITRVFVAKETSSSENLPFLEQIYAPHQTVSLAMSLTNDGWLISTGRFDLKGNYVVVTDENKIFAVQKLIKDPLTDLTFLKIEAQNLPVLKLSSFENINQGQQVLIFDKIGNLYLTEISQVSIRNIGKSEDLVRSTDYFSDFLTVNQDLSGDFFNGSPVFALDGALIGLVNQNKILPAWQFQNLITQILQNKKITRSYLGIDYLRIEETPGLLSARFKDLTNGAIVYGNPIKNSPAEKAGIKNADIIVKVDGLSLTNGLDLTYLIQNKKPGSEVEFTLLRGGEEVITKVIVGEK